MTAIIIGVSIGMALFTIGLYYLLKKVMPWVERDDEQ